MDEKLELTPVQLRVLGALMEKSVTTPEYYPLTLNSLLAAANQKTSRDPVMELEEDVVLDALEVLRDLGLVVRVDLAGSRVAKFRQNLTTKWELNPAEFAVLTVLILQGEQTRNQIRSRSERLYAFPGLDTLNEILTGLTGGRGLEPSILVERLPIRPGIREVRFRHTLGGALEVQPEALLPEEKETSRMEQEVEIAALRDEVASLRTDLESLKIAFERFKDQF